MTRRPKREIAEVISIRVKPTVYKTWAAAAAREGLTVSEWLRAAAELAVARGATR